MGPVGHAFHEWVNGHQGQRGGSQEDAGIVMRVSPLCSEGGRRFVRTRTRARSYSDIPVPVQLRKHGEARSQLGREERDGLTWGYVPSGEGTRFGALCVVVDTSVGQCMHGAERRTDGVV